MVITSLIAGIISGLLYGLFFVIQRKRALALTATTLSKIMIITTLLSALRIVILCGAWYLLLLSTPINFIILGTSFLGAFWLIVLLTQKHRV
ncbi:MAG TPA: hypothetical protein VLG71_00610 [Candidatus Limnocylindria bacterium]|nr:hypothetical protein [Candidatus Limnocylindria bacterium]